MAIVGEKFPLYLQYKLKTALNSFELASNNLRYRGFYWTMESRKYSEIKSVNMKNILGGILIITFSDDKYALHCWFANQDHAAFVLSVFAKNKVPLSEKAQKFLTENPQG